MTDLRPTILHLEDDDRDAELVEARLRAEGVDLAIIRAADGATFERCLSHPGLALILADYNLPAYDGATALETARAAAPDVPFLFVSGAIGEDVAIEAIRRGATDYVLKHRLERLVPAVRRALAEAETQRRRLAAEAERDRLLEAERAARQVAEEANRLKDEFLAIVSHELRTPLNAILGWASLVAGRPDDAAMIHRGLDAVVRNARIQKRLIEDLLDISRIVSGKLHLQSSTVDVEGFVLAAVDAVRPAAAAKGIEIAVAVTPDAGRIVADGERLQQVVWNLVTNAVKFSRDGSAVHVAAWRDGGHVVLQVTDAGCGIEPELLPYVFDRFRQGDGSRTRAHGGLGLGLAIVRHLVEMHGGLITAASEGRDRGSTFTVRLPDHTSSSIVSPRGSRDGAVLAVESEEARRTSLAGVRILVVDDEQDARELLHELLRGVGAEVSTQPSAADALGAFAELRPDLVISDIGMPGEDGFALLRRLRALPGGEGAATPAIALTAYTREMDRAEARGAGFQHFLSKPVAPALLLETIERALGRR